MTKAQLKKFVVRRNKSEFQTNLQFQIDAEACGFRIGDLGEVRPLNVGEGLPKAYEWTTPHGVLREYLGQMSLNGEV